MLWSAAAAAAAAADDDDEEHCFAAVGAPAHLC